MIQEDKKTTSEKPVSLAPLKLKEALEALLRVKPEKGKEDKGEDKEQESKEPSDES